jgi:hypothetical protein
MRRGPSVIEQALEGMHLGDHHPVLIRLHMDHITRLDRLATEIDDEIEDALDAHHAEPRGAAHDRVKAAAASTSAESTERPVRGSTNSRNDDRGCRP